MQIDRTFEKNKKQKKKETFSNSLCTNSHI